MGTVTKTIGSGGGRDFSTVQLWEDALPANLVTDGNSYVGQCFNDSEFVVAGVVVLFAGSTTDATHTITLTTGAGQSFRDNAGVQTNALRYNQANGVGLRGTDGYSNVVDIQENNVTVSNLQVAYTAGGDRTAVDQVDATFTGTVVDFCILEGNGNGGTANSVVRFRAGKMRNCLLVQRNSAAGNGITFNYGDSGIVFVNNTIVRPSDLTAAGAGLELLGGSTVNVKNVAVFGFTNDKTGNVSATTCATDDTTPSTGFTGSLTYANQFQATADATRDFRAKTGANIVDAGTTDTTNAANDIVGTSRPQGSSYDIGAWELVQGAAPTFVPYTRWTQLGPVVAQ